MFLSQLFLKPISSLSLSQKEEGFDTDTAIEGRACLRSGVCVFTSILVLSGVYLLDFLHFSSGCLVLFLWVCGGFGI